METEEVGKRSGAGLKVKDLKDISRTDWELAFSKLSKKQREMIRSSVVREMYMQSFGPTKIGFEKEFRVSLGWGDVLTTLVHIAMSLLLMYFLYWGVAYHVN